MAALAVAGLARWSGNDLEVDARGQVTALPLGAVVFATVLGVAAAQALRVVSLRTARPRRTYWLLAGLGLIVSSVPPLTAATDTATAAWLLLRTQPLLRCCGAAASIRAGKTRAGQHRNRETISMTKSVNGTATRVRPSQRTR